MSLNHIWASPHNSPPVGEQEVSILNEGNPSQSKRLEGRRATGASGTHRTSPQAVRATLGPLVSKGGELRPTFSIKLARQRLAPVKLLAPMLSDPSSTR